MKLKLSDEFKYNLFIFLSTFAKSMCEVFIPVVLYNKGFNLAAIFSYYVMMAVILLIIVYPLFKLGKIVKFKWLLIIGSFALGLSYYLLSILTISITLLFLTALSYAIFFQTYWIGRNYYAIRVLPRKNMGNLVGNIMIYSQIALIPSAYIGALAIERFGLFTLTIIVTLLAIISICPLFSLTEQKDKKKVNIFKVIKTIPKTSVIILACDQFRFATIVLFPLLIYGKVAGNYRYIGLLNTVIGSASIFFIYVFSRKMDKDKKDYLSLAIVLLAITFLIKLQVKKMVNMIIVVIVEGLISRMHLTSITRNIYSLGKNYDIASYLCTYELIGILTTLFIYSMAVIFISNLNVFLYITTFLFLASSLLKFDDGAGGY